MRQSSKILCLIVALFLMSGQLKAINSNRLSLLESRIITDDFNFSRDTVLMNYKQIQKKPIKVITKNDCITHIGYSLFVEPTESDNCLPIMHFIESYSLELNLMSSGQDRRMFEDGVQFQKGNLHLLTQFAGKENVLLNISSDMSKCVARVTCGKSVCILCFPIDYELILGDNHINLENSVFPNVKKQNADVGYKLTKSVTKDLLKFNHGLYELYNGNYKNIIENRTYYKLLNDEIVAVWDSLRPLESISNLMLGAVSSDTYTLDVKLIKYGYKTEQDELKLCDWLQYCNSEGCVLYWGCIKSDNNQIEGIFFAHNPVCGYAHILRTTINMDIISQHAGIITARLNSYIPTSQIKNLYDEY